LGQDDAVKAYIVRVLDVPVRSKVYYSRDVTFDESTFPYRNPSVYRPANPALDVPSQPIAEESYPLLPQQQHDMDVKHGDDEPIHHYEPEEPMPMKNYSYRFC
jgi:hypothetical protein